MNIEEVIDARIEMRNKELLVNIAALINDAMDLMSTTLTEAISGIERRLDKMDERFDKMDERLDKMDERFDRMDKRFDKIDERLDRMDRRFDGIDKRLDGIDERLDKIEVSVGHLSYLGNKHEGRITDLESAAFRAFVKKGAAQALPEPAR